MVQNQRQCVLYRHLSKGFPNTNPFSSRKWHKSKVVSNSPVRSLGKRVCHVEALRDVLIWQLPLGGIMVDLFNVEHDGVSRPNIDPADVHVLVEAAAIAQGSRRHDTQRLIVALEHVVEVISDVDGEFVFQVV